MWWTLVFVGGCELCDVYVNYVMFVWIMWCGCGYGAVDVVNMLCIAIYLFILWLQIEKTKKNLWLCREPCRSSGQRFFLIFFLKTLCREPYRSSRQRFLKRKKFWKLFAESPTAALGKDFFKIFFWNLFAEGSPQLSAKSDVTVTLGRYGEGLCREPDMRLSFADKLAADVPLPRVSDPRQRTWISCVEVKRLESKVMLVW
jgi:hypothetical protein